MVKPGAQEKAAKTKSATGGVTTVAGKKRRRNNPNHLVYKTSVRRILKKGGKLNAVQSGTDKILDQMFGQVQTQIMLQVNRLKNCNRKRKQTKQPGLKPFDIVNATMTLIDDPEERARVRHKVIEALRSIHTYDDEQE